MRLWSGKTIAVKAMAVVACFIASHVFAQSVPDTIVNWAASANGGAATVSTTVSTTNDPAISLNDGDRTGHAWGTGGGWKGNPTGSNPDWAQITFAATQTIDAVTVYSLQDSTTAGVEPPESLTFTKYGLVSFDVQVKAGTSWITVASITGNELVKRTVAFAPVATNAIRIVCNAGVAGAPSLVEIEAWGAVGIDNVASGALPGVAASASSTYGDNFPANALINGVTSGSTWGLSPDGGWSNSTQNSFPAWAQISFMNPQVVHALTLWTLQDGYDSVGVPNDSTTFTEWGLTAFDVQAWDGVTWNTVASVTGNDLVKRTVTFAPISTSMLRVVCNAGLQGFARIVELQAWGITAPPPPMMSGLSTKSGAPGATVKIYGDNFSVVPTANLVSFNGTPAKVTKTIVGTLTVTVPNGATKGPVSVTVNGLTTASLVSFTPANLAQTLVAGGPSISSFSPASGIYGTAITILGSGFSTTLANNIVDFNGASASVTAASAGSLTVLVPLVATVGPINVTVAGLPASSPSNFNVLPNITGFTPNSGVAGTAVKVNGTNFWATGTGGGSIWFNGIAAAYSDWTNTQIPTNVPATATTGPVKITLSGRGAVTTTSTMNFTVVTPPPTITSLNVYTGVAGQTSVIITGTNFSSSLSGNTVAFNGVNSKSITAASSTSITAVVPADAPSGTGAVTVTVGVQSASISPFTVTLPVANAAAFVSQTGIPSTMVAGQSATVTITMQNTGTATWTAAGLYRLASLNGLDWGIGSRVNVPNDITPGSNASFHFTIVAPAASATPYSFQWQMVQDGVALFGPTTPPVSITVSQAPITIGTFTTSGAINDSITINGSGFSSTANANTVTICGFNTTAATVSGTTVLTVVVPSGAITASCPAPLTVATGSMTQTSTAPFTLMPKITSISPTSGIVGAVVKITGTSFGTSAGSVGYVSLAGVQQPVPTVWSDTLIKLSIQPGATTGAFAVFTSNRLTSNNSATFTVAPSAPTLTGLSKTSGAPGDAITITGTNFSATGLGVKFAGNDSPLVTFTDAQHIVATVPNVAPVTGAVEVDTNALSVTGLSFQITGPVPTITSLAGTFNTTPPSGPVGSLVKVTGTTFSATPAQDHFTFAGLSATTLASTTTAMVVIVPTGASSGSSSIAVGGASSGGPTFNIAASPPTITQIAPSAATAGTVVTISGDYFDPTAANNTVSFNGFIAGTPTLNNGRLSVAVPDGATSGPVVVSTSAGTSADLPAAPNWAATGTAQASSEYGPGYAALGVLNGDTLGINYGAGGGWSSGTGTVPAWLEVDFASAQTVNDVTVFFPQDNVANPNLPTDTMTFSQYGMTAFDVQVLIGSTWTPVASVTGNHLVKRRVTFAAQTTTGVRILCNASPDNYCRATQVQARNDPSDFTVNGSSAPTPSITAFNPTCGPALTTIDIVGGNFSTDPNVPNVVQFGGPVKSTSVTPNSRLEIHAVVPPHFRDGLFQVIVNGAAGPSPGPYTLSCGSGGGGTATSVSGFSPLAGTPGFTTVTIAGTNFSSTLGYTVSFNGMTTPATFVSATALTATLPVGATTGPVTVQPTTGPTLGVPGGDFSVYASPAALACSSAPPSILPGQDPAFPGLWANPNRFGTGWDLTFAPVPPTPSNPNPPDLLGVTWVTFQGDGRPVWLSGLATEVDTSPSTGGDAGAKQYLVPLSYTTLIPGTGTPTKSSQVVGQVAVTFKPGSTVSAAVNWVWTSAGLAPQDECIYNYAHQPAKTSNVVANPSAYLDESFTGPWYVPSESGWGWFLTVAASADGTTLIENNDVTIFDTAGNPVWLQGQLRGSAVTMASQTVGLGYVRSAYPGGYPITACTSGCTTTTPDIGTLTRSYASSSTGSATVIASVNTTITGSDPVNWPNAPFVQSTLPSGKATDTELVLVNKTSCVIPTGSAQCGVLVSWSTSESTALVYQFNNLTQQISGAPISPNNTGSVPVMLNPGDDVHFELRVGSSTGTVKYTSAEVKVTSNASATIPSAPASVSVPASNTSGTFNVTWHPTGTGGTTTYYQIEQELNGTWTTINANLPEVPDSLITINGDGSYNYSVTVAANGTYNYGVNACNEAGCSAFVTSGAAVVTLTSGTTPVAPALPPSATSVVDLPLHEPKVGTMAGAASTDGGAAQYSMPIEVPPGRAGMQPSLAVNYNSRSGNGLMGMGWSLSGLSSIHRCPSTPEQDGMTRAVNYTNADKLCLDGQRLVLVSGSYGTAAAVYRTEVDSYARITQLTSGSSTDNLASDTTCFRVEHKDGRILHYGGITTATSCTATSVNSRVLPNNATASLSWLVEKIEDRVGNNEVIAYADEGNGEVLVDTITYTGFTPTAAAGNRTVSFAYQTRSAAGASDFSSSYLAGGLTSQTRALLSITTKVGSTTARTFTPRYSTSQYSGRLMMTSMEECVGTTCYPATQFSYNDAKLNSPANFPLVSMDGLALPTDQSDQSAGGPYALKTIADLDGDGTREAAINAVLADGPHIYLVQVTGDRRLQSAIDLGNALSAVTSNSTAFSTEPSMYADIDGDGRSELLMVPPYTYDTSSGVGKFFPTNGTLSLGVWKGARGVQASTLVTAGATPQANFAALFNTVTTNIPVSSGTQIFAADFNGDGKMDVALTGTASTCSSGLGLFVYLNAVSGSLSSQTSVTFTSANMSGSTPLPVRCLTYSGFDSGNVGAATSIQKIDHVADFDGDGLPDFYLRTENSNPSSTHFDGVALTTVTGSTLSVTLKSCSDINLVDNAANNAVDDCTWSHGLTSNPVNPANATFAQWIDVNGDGLEDYVIARPAQANGPTWRVRLNTGHGTMGLEINTGSQVGLDVNNVGGFRYAGRLPLADINGDGKPELMVPSYTQGLHGFAVKMCSAVAYQISDGDTSCPPTNESANLIAPQSNALTCAAYSCPSDPGVTGATQFNMPSATGVGNGYSHLWNGLPAYDTYNVDTSRSGYPSPGLDNSIYHLDALSFVQDVSGNFSISTVPTPLLGRLSNGGSLTQSDSIFGDGLPDLTSAIGCSNHTVNFGNAGHVNQCSVVADGISGSNAPLADGTLPCSTQSDGSCFFDTHVGLYTNINQGVPGTTQTSLQSSWLSAPTIGQTPLHAGTPILAAPVLPGLLQGVTNGLQDSAAWTYGTLAQLATVTQDGIAGYSIPTTAGEGYEDARHYYFASSMPVVSAMVQTNGIGGATGARSALYGYGQAMYNHLGRGFQGFRTITAENIAADSSRRLSTTTTFKQKFPLAGKVESVVTSPAASSGLAAHPIHSEMDAYSCVQSDASLTGCPQDPSGALPSNTGTLVYQPVLVSQSVYECDLGGIAATTCDGLNTPAANRVSHSTTTNTGWDVFGNLGTQTVVRSDDAAGGAFVSAHTVTTTNTFDSSADVIAAWWVNKLTKTQVLAQIAYATGHALPMGSSVPDVATESLFSWNADRTPNYKVMQNGILNQQSITQYAYPSPTSYGLPSSVTISATGLDAMGAPKSTYDLTAAQSPVRTSSYTYSKDGSALAADGYFVLTETNGLNQSTTTHVNPIDGRATSMQSANSLTTTTTYDVFGRATQISSPVASAINMAYTACASNACTTTGATNPGATSEDSNETGAVFRVTSTQEGYPTKVHWVDALGRTIKQASAGFSGTDTTSTPKLTYAFSATLTEYDEQGTVTLQSTPYFVGSGAPYYTGYTYDALGRPLIKTAQNACGDFMTTKYHYVGRQTKIEASGTCAGGVSSNATIKMSRSSNVLGQLMQTIDANGNTDYLTGKTTSYWTEPAGHVAAMTDVEGNITIATYNALGQRTQNADPDQGTWTFGYDAFGELMSQKDARGAQTQYLSRDAIGRPLTRTETPPTGTLTNESPSTWLDTWKYDQSAGTAQTIAIGQVGQIIRQRGTNSPVTTNPTVWQEVYTYDPQARPQTIVTTVSEDTSVAMTTGMSYDADGRLDMQTYPSGLRVQNAYTAYGQIDALHNGDTTAVYWTSQGQNAWGHTIQEQFPGLISGSHTDFDATGQSNTLSWTGAVTDNFAYQYDSFGNLHQQSRTGQAGYTETYAYDSLQRLTKAARNGADITYGYSDSGNLTAKSDYGSGYQYAAPNQRTSGCGPHAANAAGSNTYSCDANGNVIGGSTIDAVYDQENFAQAASRFNVGNNSWSHDTNGKLDYSTSSIGSRYYGPAGFEQVGAGASPKQIHEIGPVVVTRIGGVDSVSVVLRDRLGSTVDVVDNNIPTTRTFDAFGQPLLGNGNSNGGILSLADTIHGFTKHEHDDDTLLINMQGRIYDYQLGRFLQVDPIIQNPGNSQSINPYSYVLNNPLAGKDPTGYATCDVKQEMGTGSGQCNLDTGSDNKVYDGDKYLGKVTANGSGTATSFTATAAGFSYLDAHASGASAGQTPHGENTPTGQPAHEGSSVGSTTPTMTVNDAIQHQPYGIGVDPYSNLNLDQQSARWMAPGVGFVQCATGDVSCSGTETAMQAAAIPVQMAVGYAVGKAVGFAWGKIAGLWAGDAAGNVTPAGADFGPASNAANGPRLAQQLTQDSANSPFTSSGELTREAINSSRPVPNLGPGQLSNPTIPAGFGKYKTQTFQSPAGNYQAHFYQNPATGEVYYGQDYKAVFNSMSGVQKQ